MSSVRKGFLLLAVFALLLCGCSTVADTEPQKNHEEEKIQIGMSFDSFVIERWQRERDVFVSVAKEMGAEVNVQNAYGNIEEQKKQIDYFIKKGVDAIVIICIDSAELSDSVRKAKEAGIKIIAYDRLIEKADVDLYISFDNARVGTMMGEALIDAGIEGGSVLMLGGSTTDHNVTLVENAFKKVMREHQVEILDSFHAEGWRAELAGEYIYKNTQLVAKADAIMCGNDNLASQVVPALSETRLMDRKPVVGQDADLEACQRIVEGTQLMTVYKPVERLARRAAECTMDLVRGNKLEGVDVTTMNDGAYVIPYVALLPVEVTEENMMDVIVASGFHMKEDVYLNVPDKLKE